MPKFSKISEKRLLTCHQDIQAICHYAILIIDFSVVSGLRTAEEQFKLFKRGRTLVNGIWVVTDNRSVVTYKDGVKRKSRHQSGNAIDLIPFPSGYTDEKRIFELAGVIKSVGFLLKKYGDTTYDIAWGQDLWTWDTCHYELRM